MLNGIFTNIVLYIKESEHDCNADELSKVLYLGYSSKCMLHMAMLLTFRFKDDLDNPFTSQFHIQLVLCLLLLDAPQQTFRS